MTDIFKSVLTNLNDTEIDLLGPRYDYVKNIKTPAELGMSPAGNKIAQNISGLMNYVSLLVSGDSPASKNSGKPLGNKYFLKLGGKCTDKDTNQKVERSIYINNIPDGNIPFISSGMGVNFTSFKGLVPGAISNIDKIKPTQIMQAFFTENEPECRLVNLETIDSNNNKKIEGGYLTTIDIQNMSPCWFSNKRNPITNNICRETFSNLNDAYKNHETYSEEYNKLYFAVSSIFILYLIIKLANNRLK
jgi:hypothetical protein